jgi:CHAT domain-containing protein
LERTQQERESGLVESAAPTWMAARTALEAKGNIEGERRTDERSVFADDLRSARWLHFNAHGVQEFEKEWESHVGILLGPGPQGTGDASGQLKVDYRLDGLLTPREIETLELNADLVFLHGCSTTAGYLSFSSGPLNLVSAFGTVGAEYVIASHWPVSSDPRISEQVGRFYGRIAGPNPSIAEALRELRKALRQQMVPARDWGVFSIYK